MTVRTNSLLAFTLLIWASCPLLSATPPQDSLAPSRRALVIGNNNYPRAPLRNAVNDAHSVSQELTLLGFKVSLLTDVTYAEMTHGVGAFVQQVHPGDLVTVYYSGHGMQIDGENYLIPTDFSASDEIGATLSSFPLTRLLTELQARKVKFTALILDACRDNPFRLARSNQRGLAPINTAEGTFVAFATAPGSTASDGRDNNGLFTKYLVQAMQQPGLGLEEMLKVVRQNVFAASGGKQVPWTSSSILGEFTFNSSPMTASTLSIDAAIDPGLPTPNPSAIAKRSVAGASVQNVPPVNTVDPNLTSGLASLRRQDLGAAVQELSAVLSASSENASALFYRGAALLLQGRFDASIQDESEAIKIQPNLAEGFLLRSIALYSMGQTGAAATDVEEAIRRKPSLATAYQWRGHMRASNGDLAGAGPDYKQAAKLAIDSKSN